jgi:non-canonical purine NTP pyrophosphatase (RdgB/HAM1 family)
MQEIIFVTSNKGKVKSLRNRLPKGKYKIVQKDVELIEPQGENSEEVSIAKALEAYKKFKKPLVVQDSSFHVNHLKGFPGVYIKYMQESIGVDGLLKLMEGVEDRSCYFSLSLTYIENSRRFKVFNKKSSMGKLALEVDRTDSKKAWGEIWRVYIPHWADKPLSSMTEEEIDSREQDKEDDSEFGQFAKWLMEGKGW